MLSLVSVPYDSRTYIFVDAVYVVDLMYGQFLEGKASYNDVEFVIS